MSVYLRLGFNIIADEVVWKRSWLEEAISDLLDFDAYFVNVYCADSVGAEREKSRGDRHAGWNRCSARYASMDALYDLSLDTGVHCPEECAELLRQALEKGLQPAAFGLMKEKFLEIGDRD
jgi:chloramphenicol 3-O-phosphotransferase